MTALYSLDGIAKFFQRGQTTIRALDGIDLEIEAGDFVVLEGPSGSGKTTLLQLLGALDRPSAGTILFEGDDLAALPDNALAGLRLRAFGFVFQQFNLLDRVDAVANVELPLVYAGIARKSRRERALKALERVGLADRLHHRPSQLSGGQQQRVAIARALVNSPKLLLADEPTGALDSHTSLELISLFQELNTRDDMTIILVTHEADVARYASRVVRFHDGRVISDGCQQPVTP